jgi:hypothetical protein
MLTRMFAYFTLVAYLVVGTVAVRFITSEIQILSFANSYLSLIQDTSFKASANEEIAFPEIAFSEIKIPAEASVKRAVVAARKISKKIEPEIEVIISETKLAKHELPFHEPVELKKIIIEETLPTNYLASYTDFTLSETIVAEKNEVKDEVNNVAAAPVTEPEFFEYPAEKSEKEAIKETSNTEAPKTTEKSINQDIAEVGTALQETETSDYSEKPVAEQTAGPEPEYFDYPEKTPAKTAKVPASINEAKEEVAINDLISFDYSPAIPASPSAGPAMAQPKVAVTTQKSKPTKPQAPLTVQQEQATEATQGFIGNTETNTFVAAKSDVYTSALNIQALGSNLRKLTELQGFEVRFQDDLAEAQEDFGSGAVSLEMQLSQPKMTRSITLLKRGYIPTSTEVILEEGNGTVSIPMLEEDVFNNLQADYERNGSVGALLVELDDDSELAQVDVKFADVIKLNGDFKRTESDDFRYQLFMGIQAGNTLLTYKRRNGEVVNKIVHVHEHELTYDANFYEDVVNEKVRLYEEDLLAKESSPLIISGEQVKIFATQTTAKKINNHTYKMNFGTSHLGGRRYLELYHQNEPIFLGIRDNNNVTVPSENFMRFILSKVEGAQLGNRCLVQVNLTKKIEKFEVGAESVASSLMTYAQVLDSDGKFYDSVSDKTRKIIVIGESQGSSDVSADAKINIKIQYQDGSSQFLNSYCSPNTYLVEQL